MKPSLAPLLEHPYQFAKAALTVPAHDIRQLMTELSPSPFALFIETAVDAQAADAALVLAWRTAMQGWLDIEVSYPLGSAKRAAKMKAVCSKPALLQAAQAAVVGSLTPPHPLLELLAVDGSDASVDALMPYFSRATKDQDRALDQLDRLQKHAAKTPALRAMFDEVRALLTVRNDASPAMAFAERLGLVGLTSFSFNVRLGSTELTGGHVPRFQGEVSFDSTSPEWFSVWVSEVHSNGGGERTRFSSQGALRDGLKLGRCEAAAMPEWLVKAAKRLKISWGPFTTVTSNVRGAKRQRVIDWLSSKGTRSS